MGKWFSFEIIRSLVKIAGVGLVIFCISAVLGFMLSGVILPDFQVFAANQIFAPPTYNWFVCEDLGLGTVPGVPGLRQILRLCHNQGWEIRVYCLQPGLPVPPLGSTCSHTPEDTYWCDDGYQLLQEFAQDVTPTASPVPSETNTPVPTQTLLPSITATPSQTPTRTPTQTLTPTATEILTDTPPPSITPRLTRTPTLTFSPTNTPYPSNSQTPLASITPAGSSSETPLATSSSTPDNLSETPFPSITVTLTPQLLQFSETPAPTTTPTLSLPITTPRPRPGGGGNLMIVGLLGIPLGILSFAIGFLSLLLIRKNNIVLDLSFGFEKSQLPVLQKKLFIHKRILILIIMALIALSGYLIFTQIPRSLIGFRQPISDPQIVSLISDGIHTPTPFPPRHPTPIFSPEPESVSTPTFDFLSLDFSPRSGWRTITIDPPNQQVNTGKPITLSFFPDENCVFGDQRACVSAHSTEKSNLIFLSIHSGYGGEGQAFRHAVEGTGVNVAAFSLAQVQANLEALQDAQVSISADGNESGGFIVKGVIRIPATLINDYFALPIVDALELAGSLAPEIWIRIDRSQPMIIFETCGWKMPTEPGSERLKNTTGSVYVVLIQPAL